MFEGLANLPSRSVADLLAFPSIGIFGSSPAASASVEALLRTHGVAPAAYFDNDPAKQGVPFRGLIVQNAEAARAFAASGGAIVIAAAYQAEIAGQLIRTLSIPEAQVFPFVSPMFEGHFGQDAVAPWLARLERVIARLACQESKDYLQALARFRWTMSPLDLPRNPRQRGFYDYDAPGLGPKPHDHVVDCGAYTGDTAAVFWRRMQGSGRITAIEPVTRNFARLQDWVREHGLQEQVHLHKAAVGRARGSVTVMAEGAGPDPRAHVSGPHASGLSGEHSALETLDTLVTGCLDGIGFLKIDIEGFELDALEGGRDMLRASRPGLAIAGYHAPGHWVEIPERLDALCPGYRIYAGHHPSAPYECEFFCVHRDRAPQTVGSDA